MNTAKVILIPIDNRPVTYSFPLMVANVAGLEAVVPPKGLIGSLSAPADLDLLSAWIEEVLPKIKPDALLVCLDSVLYGGLASSRRSKQSLDEVMERTKQITNWKKLAGNDVKILCSLVLCAFRTIMRLVQSLTIGRNTGKCYFNGRYCCTRIN